MALCLADSLVSCGGFNPVDQMDRYLLWVNEGYLSSTGECFDVGMTVHDALMRYGSTGDPWVGSTDTYSAGNGSLMRLAAMLLFFAMDPETAVRMSGERSTFPGPGVLGRESVLTGLDGLHLGLKKGSKIYGTAEALLSGRLDLESLVRDPSHRLVTDAQRAGRPVGILRGSLPRRTGTAHCGAAGGWRRLTTPSPPAPSRPTPAANGKTRNRPGRRDRMNRFRPTL